MELIVTLEEKTSGGEAWQDPLVLLLMGCKAKLL